MKLEALRARFREAIESPPEERMALDTTPLVEQSGILIPDILGSLKLDRLFACLFYWDKFLAAGEPADFSAMANANVTASLPTKLDDCRLKDRALYAKSVRFRTAYTERDLGWALMFGESMKVAVYQKIGSSPTGEIYLDWSDRAILRIE